MASVICHDEQFFFQGVSSNSELLRFCFISLCNWSRKNRATFSTNQIQNLNKSRLATRVFPRFGHFACF